ncbi:hypothetical protein VNO78_04956 [Psophocarpus tetragonolobus]|uniref:Uncharacterized protein n=1 Tax=Psophocarpus tetragonolobus TaxID=3891 RepID=A0AAN9XR61_PSOTE
MFPFESLFELLWQLVPGVSCLYFSVVNFCCYRLLLHSRLILTYNSGDELKFFLFGIRWVKAEVKMIVKCLFSCVAGRR